MNQWDAWLAGFIDGEGCIRLDSEEFNPQPRISVANTDRAVLEEIQRREGGNVFDVGTPRRSNHKQGYEWRLYQVEPIRALLERLRPHLRVKQAEAWLVLEFLAQRTVSTDRRRISVEEQALRHGFRLALQGAK